MTRRRLTGPVGVAVALACLVPLAACTSPGVTGGPTPTVRPTPTRTPTATPTPMPTPSAAPPVAAGTQRTGTLAALTVPLFPASNPWNTAITGKAVDPRSAAYLATMPGHLHMDFGASWDGGPFGIPYTVVAGTQRKVPVTFDYVEDSDPGPYPIPPGVAIEGGQNADGDRHVLVLDKDHLRLYELWDAYPQADGSWHAGSGAVFDLRSNTLRPAGSTSADAAGLPILPGLVRYDEVAAGVIDHAIRFTVQSTQHGYVYPATHYASDKTDPNLPPMGMRVRLKASFDVTGYPPQARVILQAMKTYGLILADNGSSWFVSGTPDPRWDDDQLNTLKAVPSSAFEVVATGPVTTR